MLGEARSGHVGGSGELCLERGGGEAELGEAELGFGDEWSRRPTTIS